MNNKEKLFYIISEKILLINSGMQTNENLLAFTKYEIKLLLYLLFKKLAESIKPIILNKFIKYPEIYPDIVSTIDNPNCSCRKKVLNYFLENSVKIKEDFLDILNDHPQEDIFFSTIIEEFNKTTIDFKTKFKQKLDISSQDFNSVETSNSSIIGKIVKLNSEKEYYDLINKIHNDNLTFKGLTITENNNEIKVYFY